MEIGNEMNKQAAAPAGAGAAAMSAAAPAAAGTPPAGGVKQGVERLIIIAKGSDREEWIMAGEEVIVFRCPKCSTVFTVERDGTVTAYSSLDALIEELIEEWNLLLSDEGVTVVETRVERW